jgi:hypothetical protein
MLYAVVPAIHHWLFFLSTIHHMLLFVALDSIVALSYTNPEGTLNLIHLTAISFEYI